MFDDARSIPSHVIRVGAAGLLAVLSAGCASSTGSTTTSETLPNIVVSHSVLGAVTSEIVGSAANVIVLIPNGVDPHLYEPSAQDIETLNSADLVVVNGLGLEAQFENGLRNLRSKQIPVFEAMDHIEVRPAEAEESASGDGSRDHGDEHDGHESEGGHQHSDDDPHFWTDPRVMAGVVEELGNAITDLGLDIGDRALMYSERLSTFDQDMLERVETLPVERRVLVTGHESLGYFAERYGFEIIGTIIPGLTSGSEVSAGNLADVKQVIEKARVDVVFTELGTPSASARVLSDELGVDVVEISTHLLPESAVESGFAGDAYVNFIETLVETIVSALSQ